MTGLLIKGALMVLWDIRNLVTRWLPIVICGLVSHSGLGQRTRIDPIDVCGALSRLPGLVSVRGLAGTGKDGLVMADMTCPVAGQGDNELPAMILVEVVSFQTQEVEAHYNSWRKDSLTMPAQVLVEGNLECPKSSQYRINEQGEVVLGNGFGTLGLIRCRLTRAKLVRLHRLNN